jgi:hypothetical protein
LEPKVGRQRPKSVPTRSIGTSSPQSEGYEKKPFRAFLSFVIFRVSKPDPKLKYALYQGAAENRIVKITFLVNNEVILGKQEAIS